MKIVTKPVNQIKNKKKLHWTRITINPRPQCKQTVNNLYLPKTEWDRLFLDVDAGRIYHRCQQEPLLSKMELIAGMASNLIVMYDIAMFPNSSCSLTVFLIWKYHVPRTR